MLLLLFVSIDATYMYKYFITLGTSDPATLWQILMHLQN